jgi:hypothetical protein
LALQECAGNMGGDLCDRALARGASLAGSGWRGLLGTDTRETGPGHPEPPFCRNHWDWRGGLGHRALYRHR